VKRLLPGVPDYKERRDRFFFPQILLRKLEYFELAVPSSRPRKTVVIHEGNAVENFELMWTVS